MADYDDKRDPETPEDSELDEDGEPVEYDKPLQYDEDSANLVKDFEASKEGCEELKDIAKQVFCFFEDDWESSREHRERVAEDLKLYSGFLKTRTFPFKGASAANVPIMLENLSRLQTRIVTEIFGDWVNVVGVRPVGPDDEARATLLSRHTNWQMREEIKNFSRQMDRAALLFLLTGDVVLTSYYDARRKANRHIALTPSEFVTPYAYATTEPDLSDLPHYTWVRRFYPHELEAMRGIWENIDEVLERKPPGFSDDPDGPEREAVGQVEGEDEPGNSDSAPYKLLQWEGWLKLPMQTDHRWCQVVMDHSTKTVLCLRIHEESDWRDRERYEREQLEYQTYMEQLALYGDAVLQQERLTLGLEMMATGGPQSPDDVLALAQYGQTPEPEAPMMPGWMQQEGDKPKPVARVPIYMFAHGVCLENLVGNLGFGPGRILSDYQKGANGSLQMFNDAGALANTWTVIKTANIRLPENFGARPGRVWTANGVTGTELRDGIIEFQAKPANPQLLDVVSLFRQFGESAAQAPGILSGDAGKSGEPFRGLNTRLEQATKQLGGMAKRFSVAIKRVYENNAKLNSMYLDDLQILYISNHETGKYEGVEITRELYNRSYAIEFTSDMKFTSEAQRIAEADQLLQVALSSPDLQINKKFQYEVFKEMLLARGKPQLVQTLGMSPPPPQVFGMPSPAPAPQLGATPPMGEMADTAERGMEPVTPPPGARPE